MPTAPKISAAFVSQLSVTETFQDFVPPTNNSILINGLNETITLNATSTPPASQATAFSQALSTGTATIDLTAYPGATPSETLNATGLRLQFAKFQNPITNANSIKIGKGASNGYSIDAGGDTWSIYLSPGQSVLINTDGLSPLVSSTAKTFDLAGTGSQALNVELVFG